MRHYCSFFSLQHPALSATLSNILLIKAAGAWEQLNVQSCDLCRVMPSSGTSLNVQNQQWYLVWCSCVCNIPQGALQSVFHMVCTFHGVSPPWVSLLGIITSRVSLMEGEGCYTFLGISLGVPWWYIPGCMRDPADGGHHSAPSVRLSRDGLPASLLYRVSLGGAG